MIQGFELRIGGGGYFMDMSIVYFSFDVPRRYHCQFINYLTAKCTWVMTYLATVGVVHLILSQVLATAVPAVPHIL